jgi:hypothetical protein
MTGSSVCSPFTKETGWNKDVNATCCGLEHCPMAPTNIRMELNRQSPLRHPNPEVCALLVDPERHIITPVDPERHIITLEPVQGSRGTEERPYTAFDPDTSLFCDLRCPVSDRSGGRDEPRHIYERPREGYYAPVEICARSSQVLGLRSVSTTLWTCGEHLTLRQCRSARPRTGRSRTASWQRTSTGNRRQRW